MPPALSSPPTGRLRQLIGARPPLRPKRAWTYPRELDEHSRATAVQNVSAESFRSLSRLRREDELIVRSPDHRKDFSHV